MTAVARWLDGSGPAVSLASFAGDRAAAVPALSEALRVMREGGPLVRVASGSMSSSVWLARFGEFLTVGAEDLGADVDAAEACERWAKWIEAGESEEAIHG